METNLFPKNVFKGTNSDGSKFTSREYDFDTYATLEMGNLFLVIIMGGLFSAFISPLIFLFLVLSFNGRFSLMPIACILFSGYFLYDANHGWIFTNILSIIFDNSQMSVIYNMHYGIIVASAVMLFFSNTIHKAICSVTQEVAVRWVLFISVIGLALFIGYAKGNQYTSKQPDWVDKNLGIGIYKPDPYANQVQE